MRIEVKGRNVVVGDGLRERTERRFDKVGRQVSELALLQVELGEERGSDGPACLAVATLQLKGVTLRARESSRSLDHAVKEVADELGRQVKRHRDKRRNRRIGVEAQASPPPA